MKIKILILLIQSIACFLISCSRNTVEYRSAEDEFSYIIKTIDGQRQWGLVANLDIPECMTENIPCVYDSIFSVSHKPYNLKGIFIAMKNNRYYAIKESGEKLFNGSSFIHFEALSEKEIYDSPYYRNRPLSRAISENGNWYVYQNQEETYFFGPYDNFFAGVKGYAYKKGGKWGIMKIDLKNKHLSGLGIYEKIYVSLSEPQYDAVIEVNDKHGSFWLVRTGNNWTAINDCGKALKKSAAQIKVLLTKKLTDWEHFNRISVLKDQRVGNDIVGCIKLSR